MTKCDEQLRGINPFAALYTARPWKTHEEFRTTNGGVTNKIHHEMSEFGPQTSRELAAKFDLPVSRISALMKNDLAIGRVQRDGDHWQISSRYMESEPEIEAAKQLLRANGYSVFRSARSSR